MTEKERDELLIAMKNEAKERDEVLVSIKNELKDFKNQVNEGFISVRKEISDVKGELDKLNNTVTRMEVEHGEKIQALFDAFKMSDQRHMNHENRITICENKINRHDDEIYYLNQKIQGA